MDFSERIAAVMRHYNLQAKDLADLCGVQRTAITHILNGRNRPSVGFLSQLSDAYPELNTRWLLHGRGNIFTNVTGHNPEIIPAVNPVPTTKAADEKSSADRAPNETPPENSGNSHVTSVTKDLFDPHDTSKVDAPVSVRNSGKPIREIIIFYEDGTFKAYRPD